MAVAPPTVIYLGFIVLIILLGVEAVPEAGLVQCGRGKFKYCNKVARECPQNCPNSCFIDCASCEPICGSIDDSSTDSILPSSTILSSGRILVEEAKSGQYESGNGLIAKYEKERAEKEKKEKYEKEKIDKEKYQKYQKEKEEKEKLEKYEKEKSEKEKLEKYEKEKTYKETLEKYEKEKSEREEYEKYEKETTEKVTFEQYEKQKTEKESYEKYQKEKAEKEKYEKENSEKVEREKKEKAEKEKIENERKEKEEKEKAEKEKKEKEEKEKMEKEAREKYEKEKMEKEAREKYEKQKMEKEAREKYEKEKMEKESREKYEKEKYERETKERYEREKYEKEQREKYVKEKYERETRERYEREKLEKEKKEKYEKEQREKLEREKYEKQSEKDRENNKGKDQSDGDSNGSPSTPTPNSSPPTSGRKRVRCKNKNYNQCYGEEHVCPANCASTCEVDCVTCKPVCSCDYPGAVCQDPRFIGGDGITFYFHGKKNKDFCIVSDTNLHINAHFIGKKNSNMTRDFTWVQSLGILFNNHKLFLGARQTTTWDDSIDHLALALDGEPIFLDEIEGSTWRSTSTPLITITRTGNTNTIVLDVQGIFKITTKVVPITEEESRVHNYGITKDDCFAHLDLAFKFYTMGQNVDGVLGRTYKDDYVSKVKMGITMPVVGGEAEYETSSLFEVDCSVARFKGGLAKNEGSIMDISSLSCASGMSGAGIVCKR